MPIPHIHATKPFRSSLWLDYTTNSAFFLNFLRQGPKGCIEGGGDASGAVASNKRGNFIKSQNCKESNWVSSLRGKKQKVASLHSLLKNYL